MRVFLFRIFFQRINLMNPKSEPIQLVLPYLYLSFYLMPQITLECACAHDTVFDMSSNWIYRYTCVCLCMPLGFILRTRRVASDNHGPACPNSELGACELPVADQSAQRYRGRSIRCLFLPDPRAQLSIFLVATREHLLYCSFLYIYL